MKKRLTEVAVQKLAPDPTRRIEIYDGVATGLMLRVTENGRKSWSVMYRVAGASLDGKRGPLRRMTIGGYPLLDLKAARSGCRKIVELADSGIDPVEQRKGAIEGRNIRRFDLVLARFIELYAKVHTKKWQDTERLLRATAGEYWRGTDIQDIDRSRVHAFLDGQIEQRGQTYVREIRKHLAKLFNWAVDRGLIAASPMAGLRRPELRYVVRERVLSRDELASIWSAASQMGYPFAPIVQMLILTGQRRSEIAKLQRAWLLSGVEAFEVPASFAKTGRPHVVPLTAVTSEILAAQPIWNRGGFVFSTTSGATPASGFSKAKTRLDKLSGVSGWTIHDIRRSVATHMARLGIIQEHIERVLGHAIKGVAGTYNRYSYLKEKRAALERWEREIGRR